MTRNGFTLSELLVALVILGLITAGLWRMTRDGANSFLRVQGQSEAIASGEKALTGAGPHKGMLKDIRRCSAVTAIQTGRLSLACPDGTVEYFRQGDDLIRVAAGVPRVLARNITALAFRYFKVENGLVSLTADPALAALVEISGLRAVNRGVAYDLTASATLRNR